MPDEGPNLKLETTGRPKGGPNLTLPVRRSGLKSGFKLTTVCAMGHGSLFEGAPGAAGFLATTESPTKFLFKPFKLCMFMVGYMHISIGVKRVHRSLIQ